MIDPGKALGAARRVQILMTAGIALLAALAGLGIVVSAMNPLEIGDGLAKHAGFGAVALSSWQAWTLIAIVGVHLIFWIALLALARRLFKQLADGAPAEAAHGARVVAYLLWGMLLWGIVSQGLASVVATWGYPEGERSLSIAFGTPQISIAFSALVASFMAHAFALGAELWRDHQEVI